MSQPRLLQRHQMPLTSGQTLVKRPASTATAAAACPLLFAVAAAAAVAAACVGSATPHVTRMAGGGTRTAGGVTRSDGSTVSCTACAGVLRAECTVLAPQVLRYG